MFFQEERGSPSIISNANSCFISSSDDSVSSIVFTIAASCTSMLSSSKSICRFEIAFSNCFTYPFLTLNAVNSHPAIAPSETILRYCIEMTLTNKKVVKPPSPSPIDFIVPLT